MRFDKIKIRDVVPRGSSKVSAKRYADEIYGEIEATNFPG